MNQIDLAGKAAIVTGGARGIGYAIAERLLQSGAKVALWDMDADALAQAVKDLSALGKVVSEKMDMTNEAQVDAALAATEKQIGAVDILVNNAGIAGPTVKLWEYSPADFRKVVEIDLIGPFLCCRALVPGMMKRGYGRIVNIASIAGKEGNANASAYSAAKAGVIGMTKSLGKELATNGIMVNCITPAAAKTEFSNKFPSNTSILCCRKFRWGVLLTSKKLPRWRLGYRRAIVRLPPAVYLILPVGGRYY